VLFSLAVATFYIAWSTVIFPWPKIPFPHVAVIRIAAAVLTLTLLYFGVSRLAMAYRATAERLEQMRLEVMESSQRRTSELEALGSRLAHEIKNPLASIKGLVQLTQKATRTSPNPEATEERLAVVLQEVSRLEQVLAEYSSFTRPAAPLRRARVELGRFLRDFVTLIEGQAYALGVRVQLSALETVVIMDADRMKQALLNLAQNSMLAMPRGGELSIDVRRAERGVKITMADTGEGMSRAVLARVKEPFFSGREGGTGLGVVIAERIVEAHSGTLEFQSRPGKGTVATLWLPDTKDAP
jgi:signal transduction histidine kinase